MQDLTDDHLMREILRLNDLIKESAESILEIRAEQARRAGKS